MRNVASLIWSDSKCMWRYITGVTAKNTEYYRNRWEMHKRKFKTIFNICKYMCVYTENKCHTYLSFILFSLRSTETTPSWRQNKSLDLTSWGYKRRYCPSAHTYTLRCQTLHMHLPYNPLDHHFSRSNTVLVRPTLYDYTTNYATTVTVRCM